MEFFLLPLQGSNLEIKASCEISQKKKKKIEQNTRNIEMPKQDFNSETIFLLVMCIFYVGIYE